MTGIIRGATGLLAVLATIVAVWQGLAGNTTPALVVGIFAALLMTGFVMAWDRALGIAAAAVCGFSASAYLAVQHVAIKSGAVSICTINEVFDCDAVNRDTTFGELLGIPISIFGLAFYVAVGALALARRLRPERLDGAWRLLLLAGALSLVYSLFLAGVSHFVIKAWCLFCMCMYGANLLILVGAALALREQRRAGASEAPSLMGVLLGSRGDRSTSTMAMVGLATFFLAVLVYKGHDSGPDGTPSLEALGGFYALPAGDVILTGNEPALGSPASRYTILEYADYECPYCSIASEKLHALARAHADVRLIYKHYALSNICNDHVGGPGHVNACNASMAAECANQQGRFWELSSLLFKNQSYLQRDDIMFMARQVDLDMEAFQTCMTSQDAADKVRLDADHGAALGVKGTPAIYIHGLFGDRWIELTRPRPEVAADLLNAHRSGAPLPAPQDATMSEGR